MTPPTFGLSLDFGTFYNIATKTLNLIQGSAKPGFGFTHGDLRVVPYAVFTASPEVREDFSSLKSLTLGGGVGASLDLRLFSFLEARIFGEMSAAFKSLVDRAGRLDFDNRMTSALMVGAGACLAGAGGDGRLGVCGMYQHLTAMGNEPGGSFIGLGLHVALEDRDRWKVDTFSQPKRQEPTQQSTVIVEERAPVTPQQPSPPEPPPANPEPKKYWLQGKCGAPRGMTKEERKREEKLIEENKEKEKKLGRKLSREEERHLVLYCCYNPLERRTMWYYRPNDMDAGKSLEVCQDQ